MPLNLSIKNRLLLGAASAMLLLTVFAGMAYYTGHRSSVLLRHVYEDEVMPAFYLEQIEAELTQLRFYMVAVLSGHMTVAGSLTHARGARVDIKRYWDQFLSVHQGRFQDKSEKDLVEALAAQTANLELFLIYLERAYEKHDEDALKHLLEREWYGIHRDFVIPLKQLLDLQRDQIRLAYETSLAFEKTLTGWIALFACVALLLFLYFALRLARQIGVSLGGIAATLKRAATGDLTAEADVADDDEIGKVARLLNDTLSVLRRDRETILSLQQQRESILDTADEAMYGVDAAGNVNFVNPAMEKLLGWKEEELIGKPIHGTVHHTRPDGRPYPKEECPLYHAYVEGSVCHVEDESFWTRDGRLFPVECASSPLLENGEIKGAVVVFHDITERKRHEHEMQNGLEALQQANRKLEETQNQLLQSEKMASIGQLAAGVAHEINNPVGYVQSNVGTLERYLTGLLEVLDAYESAESATGCTPEALARINAIKQKVDLGFLKEDLGNLMKETHEGITRVKKIVQDLKDFSRAGGEENWQMADLHQGIDSTLNVARNEIKYKAEVVKEYGDLPPVNCMPSQLNQVFMNLLVNAAQAIENKGVITIRTGAADEAVWVEFEDNGKGIAPENLKRIFDPFFTTKPVGQGTGLGLSVSYGIIEKHGGRIEVNSAVGQGTRFRIWLPVGGPGQADAAQT